MGSSHRRQSPVQETGGSRSLGQSPPPPRHMLLCSLWLQFSHPCKGDLAGETEANQACPAQLLRKWLVEGCGHYSGYSGARLRLLRTGRRAHIPCAGHRPSRRPINVKEYRNQTVVALGPWEGFSITDHRPSNKLPAWVGCLQEGVACQGGPGNPRALASGPCANQVPQTSLA